MLKFFLYFGIFFLANLNAHAQNIGEVTGFNVPRFVSLKSEDINLRIGSSINYPILLKYITEDFPVEIIDEYQNWRKIKDIDNNQGWIHKTLIKGERYAIINVEFPFNAKIFTKPDGKILGEIGNLNIVKINTCLDRWCNIKLKKNKGWIHKNNLWGVYENERINIPFYQPLVDRVWKINIFYNYNKIYL